MNIMRLQDNHRRTALSAVSQSARTLRLLVWYLLTT